jgi:hypothetical protein
LLVDSNRREAALARSQQDGYGILLADDGKVWYAISVKVAGNNR